MIAMGFPERSIPLLRSVVKNDKAVRLKEHALIALFDAYLGAKEWKHAEEIFPDVAPKQDADFVASRFSQIAITSARAGANEDALRIWKRAANTDPSITKGLDVLAKAGLKRELTDFYAAMQEKLPSSRFPTLALKALDEK